ncbi:hypothetical protein ABIA44_001010 [Bradyrhizobium sp. USDA 329]
MTIRPIVRYPDRRLALPARPVIAFDDSLRDLANDLLETMRAAPGIGITAPHIGVPLRVVVLELDAKDGARTYVNPEITWASPQDDPAPRGQCLDAWGQRRGPAPCAGADQLSGPRRQHATRGVGRLARRLPPARDRPARRHVLDPTSVAAEARATGQEIREDIAGISAFRPSPHPQALFPLRLLIGALRRSRLPRAISVASASSFGSQKFLNCPIHASTA